MMPTRRSGRSSFVRASRSMTARRSTPTPWSGTSTRCSGRMRRSSIRARSASPRRGCRRLASARKIDDMTVELTTKEPDSFLPINLTNLFMASPAKWQKFYDAAAGADAKAKSQAAWDGVRARPLGHRSLEDVELHAARAAGACQERQLLGQGARAQGRQDAAAADARGQCPHRGPALRPGRLDRSAGAGCGRGNQAARFRDPDQRGTACLALAVLARRRFALERHPGPQGGQSLHRPRGPQGRPARRPDGAGDRHLRTRPSLARQAELRDQVRQARGAEADAGSRIRSEQAD